MWALGWIEQGFDCPMHLVHNECTSNCWKWMERFAEDLQTQDAVILMGLHWEEGCVFCSIVGFRDIVKCCRSLAWRRSGWKTGRWGNNLKHCQIHSDLKLRKRRGRRMMRRSVRRNRTLLPSWVMLTEECDDNTVNKFWNVLLLHRNRRIHKTQIQSC